jgi:hypothetical protein
MRTRLIAALAAVFLATAINARAEDRWVTLPPNAILPSDAECTAKVSYAPETVPGNAPFNRTTATPEQLRNLAAAGYAFEKLTDYASFQKISGSYTGTTDMQMRHAACKFGIDEDVVRAQAWQESFWRQSQVGDKQSTRHLCVQGSFDALWNTSIELINGSTVTCRNCCYQSWSAWQTKVYYEWMTWPEIKDSTSFAAEFRYATTRACINGAFQPYFTHQPPNTYARDIASYMRNPTTAGLDIILWGCIGMHYSGGWYDSGSREYIGDVRANLDCHRWLKPGVHITSHCP